jgi:hypothetical protein
MTTTYDADPNTQTIAAAWASSPLGQPERELRYGFATAEPAELDEPKSPAKRAILAAALAAGVIGGAVLGVTLFDFGDSSQPMVIEKGAVPGHAVVVGPNGTAPAPSTQVVPEQKAAPSVIAPAPQRGPSPVDLATPPVAPPSEPPVVVDVPNPDYPPLPPKPEDPQPEPPNPVPPVPDDLDLKLPEPPKPDPKPDPKPVPDDLDLKLPEPPKPDPKPIPPVFLPDLPLAPSPQLNPQPEPPSLPDLVLQAPVKS